MAWYYLCYLALPITLWWLHTATVVVYQDFKSIWYKNDRAFDIAMAYVLLLINVALIIIPLVLNGVL